MTGYRPSAIGRYTSARSTMSSSIAIGWCHVIFMPSRISLRVISCSFTSSLNDSIRAQQYGLRDREAEGPGRLQIDDELELRGVLDGNVRRTRALDDLVDEPRRLASDLALVGRVAGQAAPVDEERTVEHR